MLIDIIRQQKQHNTLIWYKLHYYLTPLQMRRLKFMQRDIITSTITWHLGLVGSNNFGEYTSFRPFTLLLCTSSFLTLSIHDTPTKLLKHFISRVFTLILSALLSPCFCSVQLTPLVQLLLHIDTSWLLSPILYCSGHFSALPSSFFYCFHLLLLFRLVGPSQVVMTKLISSLLFN